MEVLFAVLLLLGAAVVILVLPIVAVLRASRLSRDLHALRVRVAALEEELRAAGARGRAMERAPAAPTPTATAETPPRPSEAPASGVARAGAAHHVRVPELPVEPASTAPGVAAAAPAGGAGEIETAIGGRMLLYAGVVAFVLGIGFFVKYAFEHEWITEEMRVILGAACGAAFVAGGLRLARAGYLTYGNILVGGGLAALYLATYAAFDFYGLIGATTAAGLFVAITVGAAALADRQQHQGLAVMAVGGGFLTPFLVGGTTDAQLTLFSYVALLLAGTIFLARRRDWPLLYVLSFGLTVVTVAAWAQAHYAPSKYLRTQAFLTLYCAMFLAMLREAQRSRTTLKDLAQLMLAFAPVLYHFGSIANLQRHDVALPVYLILFALVGVAWSARTDTPLLRLTIWAAAMTPFLGWADVHTSPRWLVPSMATLGALFAMPLFAQLDRVFRRGSTLAGTDLLLLHLNAIGTFAAAWAILDGVALAWIPRAGLLLALVHAAAARALHPRDGNAALHALAATFTLVAAAAAAELEGRWLTAAWAAEGAAIVWIGLRVSRDVFRLGGSLLLAVAAARWLILSAPETRADFTLLANESFALGAWIIGLAYILAWRHARAAREGSGPYPIAIAGLLVGASVLTVALLSTQNASYWQVRGATMADATFAGQLALSLLWTFYAAILIGIGIRREYAPIRYAAIVLIGITLLKVFLVDLSGLEGIYRVLGLLLVGAVLLVVSFFYQRSRVQAAPPPPASAAESEQTPLR